MLKILLLVLAVLYLAPLLHVLWSPRSHGGARAGWFVLVALFSWLAYPVYLIATQKHVSAPD